MRTALTIAGSDCSGGAGIQADLKTMLANGVYGMSAVVALVAENTREVRSIQKVEPEFLEAQLDCIFQDIYPDAIKIGMVSDEKLIKVIGRKLREYGANRIVLDPVMVSSTGQRLLEEDAGQALVEELFPLADLITPNIPEGEVLTGRKFETREDRVWAAKELGKMCKGSVLLKGGHSLDDADDLLLYEGRPHWLKGKRINNPNSHGTGCTLSAAIACGLAKGDCLLKSVQDAKCYLTGALNAGLDLGKGSGPLNHGFGLRLIDFT